MKTRLARALLVGCAIAWTGSASAAPTPTQVAQMLFKRVTGVPLNPSDPRTAQMAKLVEAGKLREAAAVASADPNFLNGTARNWAAQMSTRDESPYAVFNDFQAMVLGVIRDDQDARTLLTGDFTYVGKSAGLPAVSELNNNHYAAIDAAKLDLTTALERKTPQHADISETAGVLTSRAWGEAHLLAGTNRRAIEYTFREFLCAPKEQIKSLGVPDQYVRRDVPRAPGENPQEYQTNCRSCHGILDGFGGSFARFDFAGGRIKYLGPDGIAPKMNQNSEFYPEGWVTVNDYWTNYATKDHNASFGWRGPVNGYGVRQFGEMVANSKGFGACMAKRAFQSVCKREPLEAQDQALVTAAAERFESAGYKLKGLFEDVVSQPGCISMEAYR